MFAVVFLLCFNGGCEAYQSDRTFIDERACEAEGRRVEQRIPGMFAEQWRAQHPDQPVPELILRVGCKQVEKGQVS